MSGALPLKVIRNAADGNAVVNQGAARQGPHIAHRRIGKQRDLGLRVFPQVRGRREQRVRVDPMLLLARRGANCSIVR